MSNPLQHNYFVRRVACGVALVAALGCGGKKSSQEPVPIPTAPLPTAGLAGQRVALTPLALVAAEDSLHWDTLLADRRAALDKSDSIIGTLLGARAPEVTWVGPAELRRVARRAVGIAADPDQMGTPFLRAENIVDVPDPLRYQLRTLLGLVGGRYAMVPAGLVFRKPPVGPSARPPVAVAELSVVLIDTRTGKIGWRTVARGEGDDPWTALTRAVKSLTPGLP
ncbi:MAG TPA: hypothetical protein VGQ48_14295 [Gemmatimonadales bacterium]|nr:hypothetical protein [Gemmatimonadales bacterium]